MSSPTNITDVVGGRLYKEGGIENTYEIVSGVVYLPVAENPPTDADALANWSPVVACQFHAPYRRRDVRFVEKKQGAPPMIPAPESTGAFGFQGGSITIAPPAIDSTFSSSTWVVSGGYTFYEMVAANNSDGFVLGSGPIPNLPSILSYARYRNGNQPTTGAVAQAGVDARAGYAEAVANVNFTTPYTYGNTSFYPGVFLHTGLLNGEIFYPTGPTVQSYSVADQGLAGGP